MGIIDNFKKSELAQELGVTVFPIAAGSKTHLNPLDLDITKDKDDPGDPFSEKVDFVYGCSSLTSLDVSNFDTSDVTNISSMFDNCNLNNCNPITSLESLETFEDT